MILHRSTCIVPSSALDCDVRLAPMHDNILGLYRILYTTSHQDGWQKDEQANCQRRRLFLLEAINAVRIANGQLGLERTDNNLDLTNWPQVTPINQKNYYTFVSTHQATTQFCFLASTLGNRTSLPRSRCWRFACKAFRRYN